MAMRFSYIGELGPGDRLDWGEAGGGNIPVANHLPESGDLTLYLAIARLAMDGQYEGGIVDYDAYGLKVSGRDIRRIIEDCYASEPGRFQAPDVAQYLAFADSLPPDKFVALIAYAV